MPNWVRNKVRFYGDQHEIKKMKEFVKSKDYPFDFNKIIPMPEELHLSSGSDETIAIHCYNAKQMGKNTDPEYERGYAKEKGSFDEWAELGAKYLSNKMKYGYTTWYDWCINNWGTKWNASEAYWEGNDLDFDTAWNTCEPVFKALSNMFPNVYFTVEFADEDIGSNCGLISYDDTGFKVDYIDTIEWACQVWDYDVDEYMGEAEIL